MKGDSVKILKEKVTALEQMLEMTTNHLDLTQQSLAKKKEDLERSQRNIFQSLYFSSHLQKFIQPSANDLRSAFADSFVFNRPQGIIGGDFMWARTVGEITYLACIDCTGHGVPGAMLTMAAYFCLNAVFDQSPDLNPAEFLYKFNGEFYKYFHLNGGRTGNSFNHGLDISLVKFNKETKQLRFSGTNQRLVHISKKKVTVKKGNAGYIGDEELQELDEHTIQLSQGDKIYLFTDGVVDQFGGKNDRKILPKRVIQLLKDTSSLTMKKQEELVDAYIVGWMGKNDQTDDMLMIGIKV